MCKYTDKMILIISTTLNNKMELLKNQKTF